MTVEVRGWSIAAYVAAARGGHSVVATIGAALALLAEAVLDDPAILIGPPLVDRAQADARRLAALPADAAARLPLFGVPFVVKDNIDVEGVETTAACPSFAYRAGADAAVVARLRAAGAIVVGKANLDQFATGLVGTRSPYGTPRNALDAALVPGGSSSGSAVAVARALVPFALGTDTAGSGRVPAALNGVVGLKPTIGRLSTAGVVPAVRRLDCVSVFAGSVPDAALVADVAASGSGDDDGGGRRPQPLTLAVRTVGVPERWRALLGPSAAVAVAYEAALARLAECGVAAVPVDFEPFLAAGRLLYGGPLVAERYAAVGKAVDAAGEDLDPHVGAIIARAASWTAADAYEAEYALAAHRAHARRVFGAVDALALPTTTIVPTLADVVADPFGVNARLGELTTFVNLLDLAAVVIPVGGPETTGADAATLAAASGADAAPAAATGTAVPFGLQLVGPAWSDDALVDLASRFAGGAGWPVAPAVSAGTRTLVVVGAHLRGQPLNWQLTDRGARFVAATTTAPTYRLHALAGTVPPKPGLERVGPGGDGAPIAVEVWALPDAGFADFVAQVPAPLCIGRVELADGSWHSGFLCEPVGLVGASDITNHRGWLAYLAPAVTVAPAPAPASG